MKRLLFVFWAVATTALGQANDKEIAYEQVVMQRAQKIVAALQLPDSAQFKRVSHRVAKQYLDLNILHEGVKTAKKVLTDPSEEKTKQLEAETNVRLGQLHKNYLADLAKELTPAQVDQIKDGMTYGVLPKTYRGYQEMLPDLTETQKAQILTWLTEARELAMDADTSEKKHAWFGKYKGKINNYLSAQGIDMKKAGQDWEKRIKEAKNKS
ncbi:DUF3826 domain-containing protein [Runella sp. SP2]|uniref:DUF3826 domain-containing protein n=1 Tax=Runella sp. SP2 TaxID=2268026 RepID=UPI000F0761B0|nr:DUF3826 domain-containing protein [Runella sp. SP2]AYQ34569.1 DUF3826 domain-containing protein [Runella sp. SP2]